MINIHFIINPIAGAAKNKINEAFLGAFFNSELYKITLKYSKYKKHATNLTQESIAEKAEIIVACGGDGTINEVATCLVNSDVVLGIIPTGSGNGLASNLEIPKRIENAIKILKKQVVKTIDVGQINDKVFFSNTGIGFDAQVIKHYEASLNRKLLSYINACFKSVMSLKKTPNITISINQELLTVNPFLVFISNSNEMGYNVSLTPKASLQDGLLDVLIVTKMNLLKTIVFGLLVLLKQQHLMSNVKAYKIKEMSVFNPQNNFFESQIDGGFCNIDTNRITIKIVEKGLKVIA